MTSDVYEDIKPKKIKPVTMEDGTEMVRLTLTRTPLAAPRPPRPGRSTSVGTLALGECWLGEHPHLTSPPPPPPPPPTGLLRLFLHATHACRLHRRASRHGERPAAQQRHRSRTRVRHYRPPAPQQPSHTSPARAEAGPQLPSRRGLTMAGWPAAYDR